MVESVAPPEDGSLVVVLFPPEAVVVVDIFRALGDFEDHYDVSALDQLEEQLARQMSRDVAKGLVSDALLLSFGLRRERRERMAYQSLHSRRGTLDEYRLMALIAATYWHDFGLASEASAALAVSHSQSLISLAFDIARRLEASGLTLAAPDARLLAPPEVALRVEIENRDVRGAPGLRLTIDR
jgi:hypothetical protein